MHFRRTFHFSPQNMLHYFFITTLLPFLINFENGESAKILALFPCPAKSHFFSFSPLLEELANRGHQVSVITAFPRKTPLANYKDIPVKNFWEEMYDDPANWFETRDVNVLVEMSTERSLSIEMCENFLLEPQVQQLIHSTREEFDLVIYEPFLSECAYGLIYKLKAPFIHISSNSINKWMGDGVGNPHTYSYIPEMLLSYVPPMSFRERMINTVVQTLLDLERIWIILPKMEDLMRKYFNDTSIPSVLEIETNSSFLLLNSHVALNYPRPFTPNTAEVGGMHIREPKKLPHDLQKLLDEATDGVIYFSLGTNVLSTHIPEPTRNAILRSFSRLKEKVLWKWEADTLPGLPKNVHSRKWFPQSGILAHPNVKAFITHGGLLSTQEATYFGIPLVAIPIMADQHLNAKKAADQGCAITLEFNNITENTMDWALNEILTNKQYQEKAKYLSNIFRDQPEPPLERAVFWVEYVIRHKGAPHMRSAALKLNIFQYFLLDVIAAIFLTTVILIALLVTVGKIIIQNLFLRSKEHIMKQKKTN